MEDPAIIRGAVPIARTVGQRSRTRASGSPVTSRSAITATEAAPAASTEAALSSVIPPMATSGSPFAAAPRGGVANHRQTDRGR